MPGSNYKTENCGEFLLSIIKHSDLKIVDYEAVGKEHGITAHSAYCRLRGIKAALGNSGSNSASSPASPIKRKRVGGSPKKSRTKAIGELRLVAVQDESVQDESPVKKEKVEATKASAVQQESDDDDY